MLLTLLMGLGPVKTSHRPSTEFVNFALCTVVKRNSCLCLYHRRRWAILPDAAVKHHTC